MPLKTDNVLLALDLAFSLAARLMAIVEAVKTAAAAGRDDLTAAELQGFVDEDDAARARLAAKIAARRTGG